MELFGVLCVEHDGQPAIGIAEARRRSANCNVFVVCFPVEVAVIVSKRDYFWIAAGIQTRSRRQGVYHLQSHRSPGKSKTLEVLCNVGNRLIGCNIYTDENLKS